MSYQQHTEAKLVIDRVFWRGVLIAMLIASPVWIGLLVAIWTLP